MSASRPDTETDEDPDGDAPPPQDSDLGRQYYYTEDIAPD